MAEMIVAFLASPAGVAILGALGLAAVSAVFVILRSLNRRFVIFARNTPNKIDDAFAAAFSEALEHGEDAALALAKAEIDKRKKG